MNLTDLPGEILVIIIRKLDLKSVYHLYQSCHRLKNIITLTNVINTCVMRLNTLATAQSFKLQFIKDISGHLVKLDVGGVLDLTKTSLLAAVKRMKNLKTLDVTYTNITMEDVIEVYKSCPTIKNIACNFIFASDKACSVPKNVLTECQDCFKNFDNINIVGHSTNLLYSNFALWVMQFANVNELRFTIAENHSTVYAVDEEMENNCNIVNFKNFNIYFLNDWRMNSPILSTLHIPTTLRKKPCERQYEFIAIVMFDYISVKLYVTPIFENFFKENFELELQCVDEFWQLDYVGNAAIMIWKKSDTVFDDTFYKNIKIKLLNILPNCKKEDVVAPGNVSNYTIKVLPEKVDRSSSPESPSAFKKKRLGAPSQILNYDNEINVKDEDENKKIRLTLVFLDCDNCPVILTPTSQYLKRLTYLGLIGEVMYGFEFFNVLFKYCTHLETLNIDSPTSADSVLKLARYISNSPSIKNLRLYDKRIDCDVLFSSLSQCKKLENIHIVDMGRENNNLSDPTALVRNCDNLYYIFVHASMSPTAKTRKYQIFKKLKEKFNKPYLYVQLSTMHSESKFRYDPYIDVFRLNPIRPYE